MKAFIILLMYIFSTKLMSSWALFGHTESAGFINGELIENYEDRWFWEKKNSENDYFLIYTENKKFVFIKKDKMTFYTTYNIEQSLYTDYLRKNIDVLNYKEVIKDSSIILGHIGYHKFERMLGNFAYDLAILDEKNKQYKNNGHDLHDYYVFDETIYSPVNGKVVAKVNDKEDNLPDLTFNSVLPDHNGNYLLIHVFDDIYMSLVHFKKGSIEVNVGDSIKQGQALGVVGNSGVSYIPHLHYTFFLYVKEFNRYISIPGIEI